MTARRRTVNYDGRLIPSAVQQAHLVFPSFAGTDSATMNCGSQVSAFDFLLVSIISSNLNVGTVSLGGHTLTAWASNTWHRTYICPNLTGNQTLTINMTSGSSGKAATIVRVVNADPTAIYANSHNSGSGNGSLTATPLTGKTIVVGFMGSNVSSAITNSWTGLTKTSDDSSTGSGVALSAAFAQSGASSLAVTATPSGAHSQSSLDLIAFQGHV